MSDKVKRIQIPNKYIDNKEFNNNSFYLLVILKMVCVNNHVNIYKDNLLTKLGWTAYQLRKYLRDLKDKKLIIYDFNELPKFRPIELNLQPIKHNSKNKDDYYTQVDTYTIGKIIEVSINIKVKSDKDKPKKITDVKDKALRLFYLYEMYYNVQYKCAFIGYEKIKEAMVIHSIYIKAINGILNKAGLVDVMIGDWREDIANEMRRRNPNNYVPHCNRVEIKAKKDEKI